MSNEVISYGASELTMRDGRRSGRTMSQNRASALVRISATDAAADVAQAKIDNLTMATGTAMSAVAQVALAQRHLELLVPESAPRLAYLADGHALGMGELLADLRRDLRRR